MEPRIEPVIVDEDGIERHPSFGVVRLTRRSSNPAAHLFDSSVGHSEYVHVEVARATRRRDLHRDWIFGNPDTLIEFDLSLSQWGALVSSFNQGSGTPVTLSRIGDERMPEAEHVSRLAVTAQEVADKSTTAAAQVKAAVDAVEEAFERRAGRREMTDLLRILHHTIGNLPSNMQFAADALTEHAEEVVTKARADIEATAQFWAVQARWEAPMAPRTDILFPPAELKAAYAAQVEESENDRVQQRAAKTCPVRPTPPTKEIVMATTTAPYFTRVHDGGWGIAGPLELMKDALKTGGTVDVTNKKSGETVCVRLAGALTVRDSLGIVSSFTEVGRVNPGPAPAGRARSGYSNASRRRRTYACPTGGNCSSFGNGQSCGSDECDGW